MPSRKPRDDASALSRVYEAACCTPILVGPHAVGLLAPRGVGVTIRLLQGDCRITLSALPEKSVHACITSPPYWGLRDYGTPPLVWGGEAGHAHEWQTFTRKGKSGGLSPKQVTNVGAWYAPTSQATCACGAWLGSLGLEPTPELFIEHLTECFRAVARVLRDDGTLWLNLGDSYAGSGKGPTGHNGIGDQTTRQGFHGHSAAYEAGRRNGVIGPEAAAEHGGQMADRSISGNQMRVRGVEGAKAKDLLMIPFRVAMALQADGWYLRSVIPWIKRNSMPESVQDRPATAVEYVFLLSKSRRYFWDADAVRIDASLNTHSRGKGTGVKNPSTAFGQGIRNNEDFTSRINGHVSARNRRNTDWFIESWQGLLLDESDEPLALVVNPAPFKESHFATFPPRLVEPMVKASTSERGVCAECGAPWRRTTERSFQPTQDPKFPKGGRKGLDASNGWGETPRGNTLSATTGWQPTCAHADADVVPATVLDPFAGAATALLVADRLNRHGIGCELKPDYAAMSKQRVEGDAPLFVQVGLL